MGATALSTALLAPNTTHAEVGGTVTKVAPISAQVDEDNEDQTSQTVIRNGKIETVDVTKSDEDKALEKALDDETSTNNSTDQTTTPTTDDATKSDAKQNTTEPSSTEKASEKQTVGAGNTIHFSKTNDKIEVYSENWSAKSFADVYTSLQEQGVDLNNLENGEYYIIEWGDTLNTISDVTRVPVLKLAKDNNIINIDKIYAGTKILIKK